MKKYLIIILLLTLLSCTKKTFNSPLATIVKLESAQEVKNYNEAIKYIDVNKTYSRCKEGGITPYDCWVQYVNFSYNFGRADKKFTNRFGYYNYDIKESIKENKSTVEFISLRRKKKEIIYSLDLIKQNWIVVGIEYIK